MDQKYLKPFVLSVIILPFIISGGIIWYLSHRILLPSGTTDKITSFTPYFYKGTIPAKYTVGTTQISPNGHLMMVQLTKPGNPAVVLTEQIFPSKLTDKDLQQNGESVNVSTGKATINSVEGRLVGTLIPSDRHTLILLNAPGDASKDDLRDLLQRLRPLR